MIDAEWSGVVDGQEITVRYLYRIVPADWQWHGGRAYLVHPEDIEIYIISIRPGFSGNEDAVIDAIAETIERESAMDGQR